MPFSNQSKQKAYTSKYLNVVNKSLVVGEDQNWNTGAPYVNW